MARIERRDHKSLSPLAPKPNRAHLEGGHVLHGADVVELDGLVSGAGHQPVTVFVPRYLDRAGRTPRSDALAAKTNNTGRDKAKGTAAVNTTTLGGRDFIGNIV